MPVEVQQMLMQNPNVRALVDQFNAQKEQQNGGQATAPTQQVEQPVPDASIPQAQPME
jgi:hypothetical protein